MDLWCLFLLRYKMFFILLYFKDYFMCMVRELYINFEYFLGYDSMYFKFLGYNSELDVERNLF